MISLTIDGHPIRVPAGTSILEAAGWLGIRIPTMCHVPGIEAAAACFVCAVQIEGRRTMSPSCAMPVAEGIVVITNSDDVRKARRMALELLFSDHAGECEAPCAARCPAGLDIPGFVRDIAGGDNRGAMEVISRRLALAGSLGRVCPRLCEQNCRRCDLDQGLAIGALHRYAADLSPDFLPSVAATSGKRVAIIGAGPAGLTAACYLQQQGHACTLFDSHDQAGGMLRYGIPAYRLPKDALDSEIDVVRRLGAEFRMNCRWGTEFNLTQLRAQFDAVFVGIGAQAAQTLRCPGEELAIPGIGFLEQVAQGSPPATGGDVIIIGGGNTAMDCARTAVRLGARVRVFYRRTRQEMPCLIEEVEGAEAEGVIIEYLIAPVRLERTAAGLALVCQRMTLGEPDASGRRRPVPVEDSEFSVECSAVISATGQSVALSIAKQEGLAVTSWGIAADQHTMATNLPGVFAGGDAVLGADLAVRAVAAGRMAAESIHQFLSGEPVTGEAQRAAIDMKPVNDSERAAIFRAIEQAARVPVPTIPIEQRVITFDEVEGRLPHAAAALEAQRCMTCGCRKADCCTIRALGTEYFVDVHRFNGQRRRYAQDLSHPEIIYEPGKCISCDACVRIAAAEGEELGLTMIGRGFDVRVGVPFDKPLSEGLRHAAGRCAAACPTGALALRTTRACQFS